MKRPFPIFWVHRRRDNGKPRPMCGFSGLLSARSVDRDLLQRMGDAIAHRGPDDEGQWLDHEAGIGLAHRRLAIVDLSPSGHQPMVSEDGRLILVFNGEIYNHQSIRAGLEASGRSPEHGWRGHSDTETLLQAIAVWGLERALKCAVGMFALALWDRFERRLSLARDRFGEKPLYYGWAEKDFVFGSELKALRCHPEFPKAVDRQALAAYAARNYVPAPYSIHPNVFKLPPGHILTIGLPAAATPSAAPLTSVPYWRYRDVALGGLNELISDEADALAELEQVLGSALAGQSMADVPIGAFLSGGVDSSLVCALYQQHSTSKIRTFSIGFEESAYDESARARAVADHLATDHHELIATVAECRDVIPLLPTIFDEPFADSSQIPTYLVSRFARGEVTVAISGDGGDELFAGYNRHQAFPRFWGKMSQLPAPLRRAGSDAVGRVPASALRFLGRVSGLSRLTANPGKIRKFAKVAANANGVEDVTDAFLDEWHGLGNPVRGVAPFRRASDLGPAPDLVSVTYADAVGYLPDDILVKVDRASMAVSLESRVPFLDHRVAALAARIDPALKVRGGKGKHILRTLLDRHVPRPLIDRPKAGFAVPVGEWIKGPLRDWAEYLLDRRRLEQGGYWDAGLVRARWDAHLAGVDSTPAIWSVLMFQAWLESQKR